MQKKRRLVISTLLMAIILLSVGTIAYFRRTVNGTVTAQTGNIVLIVNDANAQASETFEVVLERSEEENFIMPDDKGTFDLNIDSTGSTTDVGVTITISRINLPDNLKFYLDEDYTQELTTYATLINKSEDMTKTVPVYWFWDGSISDEIDSDFIGETISANIKVVATRTKKIYDTLLNSYSMVDTDIDFKSYKIIASGEYELYDHSLLMRDGTQNDKYPILYYRGDITDNNVIFADLCWLIVRTTETGGIKLVFNGPVVENADGTQSCSNYSGVGGQTANTDYTDVYVGNTTIKFNTNYNSPVYVGYMYNDTNRFYNTSTKKLDGTGYISHLSDNSIDSETGRHVQNLKDSTIKGVVDDWYEENILGKPEESLLEDTVWCNDRSVISETYTIANFTNGSKTHFYFATLTRQNENTVLTPSLTCSRDIDKFTVDSANGNGDLTYPIGMLTVDEMNLAGNINVSLDTFLNLKIGYYWTLSPASFGSTITTTCAYMYYLNANNGSVTGTIVDATRGVRPAISLKNTTMIFSGNGSFDSPYIVG